MSIKAIKEALDYFEEKRCSTDCQSEDEAHRTGERTQGVCMTRERQLEQRLMRIEAIAVEAEAERQKAGYISASNEAIASLPPQSLSDVLAMSAEAWTLAARIEADVNRAKQPTHARWRMT